LNPAAIEEVVRSTEGLSDEFEIIVDKEGNIDRITLKVEILKNREKEQNQIEAKAKRFKDLRKK